MAFGWGDNAWGAFAWGGDYVVAPTTNVAMLLDPGDASSLASRIDRGFILGSSGVSVLTDAGRSSSLVDPGGGG